MTGAGRANEVREVVDEIVEAGADIQTLDRARTLVGRTPALDTGERSQMLRLLSMVVPNGSATFREQVERLSGLDLTPTLEVAPIIFPPLPPAYTATWRTLMNLETVGVPWVLVGGNMVALHCLEHGRSPSRSTDDGDIVVDVWTHRSALRRVTRHLVDLGYEETDADGMSLGFEETVGFKYVNEDSRIDVLVPENTERQRRQPTTARGSTGMAAVGANRSLIRAQRVPVVVDSTAGFIRRPSLVGALTIKARAAIADRQPTRHLEDIGELLTIMSPMRRDLRAQVADKDKRWYRKLLRMQGASLDDEHRRVLIYLINDPRARSAAPGRSEGG